MLGPCYEKSRIYIYYCYPGRDDFVCKKIVYQKCQISCKWPHNWQSIRLDFYKNYGDELQMLDIKLSLKNRVCTACHGPVHLAL